MPPALALSGIPLPVSAERGLTYTPTLLGEHRRAFSGWLRSSERREVFTLAGNTGPLTQEEARAYRGLLKGEGQVWSFEDGLRSQAFLSPSAMVGNAWAVEAMGRFGGCMLMEAGASVTFPTGLGTKWTVAYWWKRQGTKDRWRHHVHRAGVGLHVNGASGPVPHTGGFFVVDGVGQLPQGGVTLSNAAGGGELLVDELVVLPWVAPASWVAPWFAAGESFGAPYPYHRASGAALYEPLPVLGRVGTGRAVQWWEGGVLVLGQEFDFELQER